MFLLRTAGTLLVIALAGCAHKVSLQTPDGQLIGIASFDYEENNAGNISLDRYGENYRGKWSATKVDESAIIADTYGIGSRKYKEYIRGSGEYLRSGESKLQSDKGDILNCQFKYRGSVIQGTCESNTETFKFINKPD